MPRSSGVWWYAEAMSSEAMLDEYNLSLYVVAMLRPHADDQSNSTWQTLTFQLNPQRILPLSSNLVFVVVELHS
eukprot:5643152-Amphidinium_carterae.1